MKEVRPNADVGVIVGRFQTPALHKGHIELIQEVLANHKKVVIFLGSRPGLKLTRTNPLDFFTRKRMLQARFPQVTIMPIMDHPTDTAWSNALDTKIEELTDGLTVLLYGSRDSFVPYYTGKYSVIQLADSHKISATEVREMVANTVLKSEFFRQGIIYAAFNRWAVSYQTVDMVCVKQTDEGPEIILARKTTDPKGLWRFPGGFVNTEDASLEAAAGRELGEEVKGISVHAKPVYLGSCRVDDWRYRGEDDQIMTSVFLFNFFSGAPEAADDICDVDWFPITDTTRAVILPGHQPIFDMASAYLNRSKI